MAIAGSIRSDLPPELTLREGTTAPTEEQKKKVLREAVNFYIRTTFRAPDVRKICEDFIAAIDGVATGGGETPPDVAPVTITPTSATAPAIGSTGTITVTITGPSVSGTWTVDKDSTATWLTYTPTTPQAASGTINWTAAANLGVGRAANFYINGKTFALTQIGTP